MDSVELVSRLLMVVVGAVTFGLWIGYHWGHYWGQKDGDARATSWERRFHDAEGERDYAMKRDGMSSAVVDAVRAALVEYDAELQR